MARNRIRTLERALQKSNIILTKYAMMETLLGMLLQAQPKAIETIRKNKFVFKGKGGRWEKLAFTFYTHICEIDQWARQAKEEMIELDAPRLRRSIKTILKTPSGCRVPGKPFGSAVRKIMLARGK